MPWVTEDRQECLSYRLRFQVRTGNCKLSTSWTN